MPGMAGMLSMGKPQRSLTVRLWSPGLAPDDATAALAVPAGLQQGPKLELSLYRPKPAEGTAGAGGGGVAELPEGRKMTIKRYWGSSATVRPGQPVVSTFGDLTPEQRAAAQAEMRRAQEEAQRRGTSGGSYFYKPDWTTGYWPTQQQPGQIVPDARLEGHWALNSSYTGNVEFDVPQHVDFLDGIELTAPDLSEAPPLDQAMHFQWRPIVNCLGLHAVIMGMVGQDTIVIWSSSEVPDDNVMGDGGFMQMADVRANVEKTIFMAGNSAEVTVPAGIFDGCDFVNLTMAGWGNGTALDEAQPLPRVQTKTTLTCMLGGKMMANMGRGRD
jgi:hypothetical protein